MQNADRYRLQLLFTYLISYLFTPLSLPQFCIGFNSYHFPNLHKPFCDILNCIHTSACEANKLLLYIVK